MTDLSASSLGQEAPVRVNRMLCGLLCAQSALIKPGDSLIKLICHKLLPLGADLMCGGEDGSSSGRL